MRLGEELTAILPQRALERTRFVPIDQFEIIQDCKARRKHREAERDIKH